MAPLRDYLLALLSARLGDGAEARAHAGRLAERAVQPDAENLKKDLIRSVEAHSAWWRKDPERVLESLEQTRMETRFDLLFASPFHSQASERQLRAEARFLLRHDDKALRWYRTFEENSLFDLPYLAGSHLRRGEIQERLGRRQQALRNLSRAVSLWKNCDPLLFPAREEAEALRLRLQAGSPLSPL